MAPGTRDGERGPGRGRDTSPRSFGRIELRWDAESKRRYGRTAALLFIGAALTALPSSLLLGFHPAAAGYAIIALSVAVGTACFAAPWDRLSWAWLHAANLAAVLLVALGNAAADRTYAIYYVFPAVFAAYVFRSRAAVILHLTVISLALAGPIAYGHESVRLSAMTALAGIPALFLVAGTVLFLRERLEARERSYRRFAEEAIQISVQLRLRGHEGVAPEEALQADRELGQLQEIASALEALRQSEREAGLRPGPIPMRPQRRRRASPPRPRAA